MALDLNQERAAFEAWAGVEYRHAENYTKRDYRMGLAAWTAGRAALASQPRVAAPSDEHVSVVGMPEFDALLDHIYEHGTTSEGVRSRADALARALLARYGRPAGDAE